MEFFKRDGSKVDLLQYNDIETGNEYIKFPNGIMISFFTIEVSGRSIQNNYLYLANFETNKKFTIPFISNPTVVATVSNNSGSLYRVESSKTGIGRIVISINNAYDFSSEVSIIAIGKWK